MQIDVYNIANMVTSSKYIINKMQMYTGRQVCIDKCKGTLQNVQYKLL
jgi:hypothetical protein